MEKISDRLYKLSSGHILKIKIPPIPKVFKMVSLIGSAVKNIDIESAVKNFFGSFKKLEDFDIGNVDINVLRDLLAFLMEQDEFYMIVLENMKTSLLDDKPCDFEQDEYREDLLEAMFIYLKEVIYPFIRTPISKLRSQLGEMEEAK